MTNSNGKRLKATGPHALRMTMKFLITKVSANFALASETISINAQTPHHPSPQRAQQQAPGFLFLLQAGSLIDLSHRVKGSTAAQDFRPSLQTHHPCLQSPPSAAHPCPQRLLLLRHLQHPRRCRRPLSYLLHLCLRRSTQSQHLPVRQ